MSAHLPPDPVDEALKSGVSTRAASRRRLKARRAAKSAVEVAERGCGAPLANYTTNCGRIDSLTGKLQYCFACNRALYHARLTRDAVEQEDAP